MDIIIFLKFREKGINMLRKTIQLIKNNPCISICQMVYIVILFLGLFLLYSVGQNEISSYIDYTLYSGKFFISSILSLLIGMVFIAGFGNALSEVITSGKCGFTDFYVGIKRYYMKSVLSVLVLYIIYVVCSTILFPTVSHIIVDMFNPYGEIRRISYDVCIYILNILIMPFTMLFLPAIYIDHYDIIPGLITGMRLAARNYYKLVWVLSIMFIPIIIDVIFIKDAVMFVFTPLSIEYIHNTIAVLSGNGFTISTIIMYLVEVVIFLVSAPLFFVIYAESSSKRLIY